MTDMKRKDIDDYTFCEKNLPRIFYQAMFFPEIFQNQMLKVKICPFLKQNLVLA